MKVYVNIFLGEEMKLLNTEETIIKKSRFIAYFYQVDSKEDAENVVDFLKVEHKNARHIPYAYLLPNTAKKTDDKEPTGTCGTPLLTLLERNQLNNNLIAVVRYFGGTKLGASNLLRAYLNTANEAIKNYQE